MSEKQKEALKTIMEAVPKLPEFEKGRIIGYAERMEAEAREAQQAKKEEDEDDV